jgi:ankyrin repeat protein
MRTLVDCGVDINGRTGQEERTPLMLGAIVGNEVAVEELLKLNADPRLQDFEGNTALHHACSFDQ